MNDDNDDRTEYQTEEDRQKLEKDIQNGLYEVDSEDDTTIEANQRLDS